MHDDHASCVRAEGKKTKFLSIGYPEADLPQRTSNHNTHGDPNCDVVERNAKSHTDSSANGNAHADGRFTCGATSQVSLPIHSSTHHNDVEVDADPIAG